MLVNAVRVLVKGVRMLPESMRGHGQAVKDLVEA
jgi:hypothetical protein